MIDTSDLRKLARGLAELYGWENPSRERHTVTGLLLGAADEIDRLREENAALMRAVGRTAEAFILKGSVADKAQHTADYGKYKKDDQAQ